MNRSRFFLILLICAVVVFISAPGAAALHESAQGSGHGSVNAPGSDSGSAAGATSHTPEGPSGFRSPGEPGSPGSVPEHSRAGTGKETSSYIPDQGLASGFGGSSLPKQNAEPGLSPVNVQGPGSPPDSGDSRDDAPPGPPSRSPDGPEPSTGESPHRRADGTGQSGTGFAHSWQGSESGSARGGVVLSAPIRGAAASGLGFAALHTLQTPTPGSGVAGQPARNRIPHHQDPTRDSTQKNVPPETPARITKDYPEIPPRPKGKREDESDTAGETCCSLASPLAPATPADIPAGIFLPLFGFRRIQKKNVLEHEDRKAIFQAIAEAPGLDAVTLSRKLGININTLRYHLAKLLVTEKIIYLSRPGTVRYYLNQGLFSPLEQVMFCYLTSGTTGQIITVVAERPGVTRKDLAEILGISGPSVTRHVELLRSEGIIRNEPDGRANHYYLTEESASFLDTFQRVSAERRGGILPEPV